MLTEKQIADISSRCLHYDRSLDVIKFAREIEKHARDYEFERWYREQYPGLLKDKEN